MNTSPGSDGRVKMIAANTEGIALGFLDASFTGGPNYSGIGMVTATTPQGNVAIWVDGQGRATQAQFDQTTVLFANWTSTTVDVAIVGADGSVRVQRGVSVPPTMSSELSKSAASVIGVGGGLANATTVSPTALLKWGSLLLSTVGCATSIASSIIPAAVLLCSSAILKAVSIFSSNDDQRLTGSAVALGAIGNVVGCIGGDAYSCAGTVATLAASAGTIALNALLSAQGSVQTAKGALAGGGGDVQVTLTWDSNVDLDLWVTDPRGEKIYYSHTASASGGVLDNDNQHGSGPENIYWARGRAPAGKYIVQVNYYAGSLVAHYTVLLQQAGIAKTYRGTLSSSGSLANVATFTYGSALPLLLPSIQVNSLPRESKPPS